MVRADVFHGAGARCRAPIIFAADAAMYKGRMTTESDNDAREILVLPRQIEPLIGPLEVNKRFQASA